VFAWGFGILAILIISRIILKLEKLLLHKKNNFAEIFKNLSKYRFENNFLTIKIIT